MNQRAVLFPGTASCSEAPRRQGAHMGVAQDQSAGVTQILVVGSICHFGTCFCVNSICPFYKTSF